MATALSLQRVPPPQPPPPNSAARCSAVPRPSRPWDPPTRLASLRADDSSPTPFEMTVRGALKLLWFAEGQSFDEILHAKNVVAASCKGVQDALPGPLPRIRPNGTMRPVSTPEGNYSNEVGRSARGIGDGSAV